MYERPRYDPALTTFAGLVLGGLIPLLLCLAALSLAAPAPLPRQDRRPAVPLVPGECLLIWHAGKYHACFRPDGDYGAVPLSGGVEWRGTWRRDGGAVLVTEYATGWAPTQTITWRASVGGDDPVRLEPWVGRPKLD